MTPDLHLGPVPPAGLVPTPEAMEDGVDLVEVATRFIVQWRRFLLWSVAVFAVCAAIIFHIKPQYEAYASILPQNRQDTSDLATFFSGRSPGDVFIGLLASRSVADEVITQLNLRDFFHVQSEEQARGALAARTVFAEGRDTMIVIRVHDENAEAAMRIANAYVEALEVQRSKMLLHESEQENRFFEQQLAKETEALAAAEQALENTQETTGLVAPEAQTQIGLGAIAGVRAQITNLQVQLASMLQGESEQNPEVRAVRAQLAQLQSQERALETSSAGAGAGAAASARKMPQLNLDFARKQRTVRYHEALVNSISTQYETARLNDGHSGAPFVVVDRAVAPESRSYPPRELWLKFAFGFSLLCGAVAVVLTLVWRKLKADPAQHARFAEIRQSFRLFR